MPENKHGSIEPTGDGYSSDAQRSSPNSWSAQAAALPLQTPQPFEPSIGS